MNIFSQDQQVINLTKEIKLTNVDRNDREAVRQVIRGLITFDETMPKLEFSFVSKSHHYTMNIRGWNSNVDIKKFYDTFLSDYRDARYDPIMKAFCVPSPESGRGSYLTLWITRTSWSSNAKSSKRKKKKR